VEKEVELRFKLDENQITKVKKSLNELGEFLGEFNQIDEYFYDKKLGRTKDGYILRVRKSQKGVFLTYKKLFEDSWIEEETEIKDKEAIKKIIQVIGLVPLVTINKTRLQFRVGDFEVNLDKVKNLGSFVEIELVSKDISLAKKKILELANKLGLKNEIHKGYVPLMLGE